MAYLLAQSDQSELSYNDFYAFFKKNAEDVCSDPRPLPFQSSSSSDSDISDYDAVLAPLSDIWFLLDTDRDGQASQEDLKKAFAGMDFDSDGNITELEFH